MVIDTTVCGQLLRVPCEFLSRQRVAGAATSIFDKWYAAVLRAALFLSVLFADEKSMDDMFPEECGTVGQVSPGTALLRAP